jgi:hypothetical protein
MEIIALMHHIVPSAIIVISFFFAMRCIFVHEMRLEAWRSPVKHIIYVERGTFRVMVMATGWLCLLIFLFATYSQILKLLEG